jgi:hypothetical protein
MGDIGKHVLMAVDDELHKLKSSADRAIAQLADDELFIQLNSDQNSIYVILKHMAGNMLSRWTDFRTTDGEKPNRNRDEEFVERRVSRAEILAYWERGWARCFAAVASMRPEELDQPLIVIRGQRMSVFEALNRQTAHYAYHVGQIILIAKHICGPRWKYLTIPRGQSEQFHQQMLKK